MTSADPSPSTESAPGSFADELRSLYEARQRAEDEIAAALAARRQALAEAERIVADAQLAATTRQAEAAAQASLATAEARGRAEQILAEADEAARALVAAAERDAAPVLREAAATQARARALEAEAAALVANAEREAELQRALVARDTAALRDATLTDVLARTDGQLLRLEGVARELDQVLGTASGLLADERLTMGALTGAPTAPTAAPTAARAGSTAAG